MTVNLLSSMQLKLIEIAEPLTTLQEVTQAERNGNKIDM